MTITFIMGASQGLGHETARRLIDEGRTVLAGAPSWARLARTPDR